MPRHDIFKEEEIANMLDGWGDSSEDEFPNVDVVVRQYRDKVQEKEGGRNRRGDKGNAPAKGESVPQMNSDMKKGPIVKATPLRRRKLGQSQTVDGSLLKRWDDRTSTIEKDNKAPKPRSSRTRFREASTEANFSSRETSELMPAQARKVGSASKDVKAPSREQSNRKRSDEKKFRNVEGTQSPKQPTRNSMPSDESSGESDVLKETLELSEEEVSEFVSISESESDAWNSDSEPSSTLPVRRSKSPTIQWAKPQRTLFKDPGTKTAHGNKQSQTTINNPSKQAPKQRRQGNSSDSLKTSQPGDLEDALQKLKIFNGDSEPEKPSIKGVKKPILEPTTPKKTLKTIPTSPSKTPKIPISPWKPEQKEFWAPEVHFAWIDQHSPEKPADNTKKTKQLSAQDLEAEVKRKYGTSPEKRDARKAFDAAKEELARNFLAELDERITDGQLAKLTKDTGGLRITWSNTLQTTAGRAHWKCKTLSHTTKHADGTTVSKREERQHHASIELACKVLSNESDLLNTVAHEFCHLAVFMLNGKPKTAHGPEFKAWGARCGQLFKDRGIVVTTKHNYVIDYKYIWKCADCQCEVKRQSKSVDPVRQRCGRCRGNLIQVKPATTTRKKSAWTEFVGEEMRALGQTNPGMPFKERMAIVSAKWAELQQSQKGTQKKEEGKGGQTMKELRAAVEVLQIDDDEYAEDEEVVKAAAREAGAYDIFS
ncbi:SprT-like family-domain-containing protein [Hypoxylon sp. FL0890]|nr:SprT-like family-domain-containing protein [Hypoxylon sp. FL0890]